MPSDYVSPVTWIIDSTPRMPTRINGDVLLPTGYLDLWDAYLELGKKLHPGHWKAQATSSGQFPEVAEFNFAAEFARMKSIPSKAIEGGLAILKFALEDDPSGLEPTLENVRKGIEPERRERRDTLRPFYNRYCEVRDEIYNGFYNQAITPSGLTVLGERKVINPSSWRSRAGQQAAVRGTATLKEGQIVLGRKAGDSTYIIVPIAEILSLVAELIPESSDINFIPCKNHLISLMRSSPMKDTPKKTIQYELKQKGIMPKRRNFQRAYVEALKVFKSGLSDEDAINTPWGRRGKKSNNN